MDRAETEVDVSLDDVHFTPADTFQTEWSTQVQLVPGANTIYAKADYPWGGYSTTYSIDPITVTLDAIPPTVTVTAPTLNSNVRSSFAEINWQSSDNIGIATTELWDGAHWIEVQGNSYKMWVAPSVHQVIVRVTDGAGNQATSSVTFKSDSRAMSFNRPYYGLP